MINFFITILYHIFSHNCLSLIYYLKGGMVMYVYEELSLDSENRSRISFLCWESHGGKFNMKIILHDMYI